MDYTLNLSHYTYFHYYTHCVCIIRFEDLDYVMHIPFEDLHTLCVYHSVRGLRLCIAHINLDNWLKSWNYRLWNYTSTKEIFHIDLIDNRDLRGRVLNASRFETSRPSPLGFESHESELSVANGRLLIHTQEQNVPPAVENEYHIFITRYGWKNGA